jgi:hypothetical protein
MAYTTWLFINHNQLFYTFLFGPDGWQAYMGQHSGSMSAWQQFFVASQWGYYIMLAGLAFLVGLAVFTILQIVSTVFRESKEVIEETLPGSHRPRNIRLEIAHKFLLRAFAAGGWVVYTTFFVNSLVPFTVTLSQTGVDSLETGRHAGALVCLGAFLLLTTAVHVHVIFVRLVSLRVRLIGGEDEIIVAQAETGHVV